VTNPAKLVTIVNVGDRILYRGTAYTVTKLHDKEQGSCPCCQYDVELISEYGDDDYILRTEIEAVWNDGQWIKP
jgi:hypothetical protein